MIAFRKYWFDASMESDAYKLMIEWSNPIREYTTIILIRLIVQIS